MFSFNAPYGSCPDCKGLGFKQKISEQLIIPDKEKTLASSKYLLSKLFNIPSYGSKLFISLPLLVLNLNSIGSLVPRRIISNSFWEAQRIRLATQIGSQLTGVLYVLDEPSIGLHQRDNQRLIDSLLKMRDLGNTLVVVEHDTDTMLQADYLAYQCSYQLNQ